MTGQNQIVWSNKINIKFPQWSSYEIWHILYGLAITTNCLSYCKCILYVYLQW